MSCFVFEWLNCVWFYISFLKSYLMSSLFYSKLVLLVLKKKMLVKCILYSVPWGCQWLWDKGQG